MPSDLDALLSLDGASFEAAEAFFRSSGFTPPITVCR